MEEVLSEVLIGVIGGSGLYEMKELEDVEEVVIDTPFGPPSAPFIIGTLSGKRIAFLPRHGIGHVLMPSEIPFLANIYGFRKLGCEWIISVSAVGSMKEEIHPGDIVIPDQFIDLTTKRRSTFFGDGLVAHVSMADPVCSDLSTIIENAARDSGAIVHRGGTYVCMEGPQFSSRSESYRYRDWDASIIGMTNMPEAKLAREAEMSYATIALSTDYDCWHEDEEDVDVESVIALVKRNAKLARTIITRSVSQIEGKSPFSGILKTSIISDLKSISKETLSRLELLVGKYIN